LVTCRNLSLKIWRISFFFLEFFLEKCFVYVEIIFFRSKFDENLPVKESLLRRTMFQFGIRRQSVDIADAIQSRY
jgi:hypothetical protein